MRKKCPFIWQSNRRRRSKAFCLFLAPSFLGVLLFVILPFGDVVRRSFTTAVTGKFNGIGNYQMIFTNEAFLLAVKNTIRFTVTGIPLLVVTGLVVALLLSNLKDAGWIKTLYLFPLAMPTATVVIVWKMIPDYPTFSHYGKLLFMTPQFFVLFWNSVKLVGCILTGQLLVGVPAAWAFAAYRVKGSRALFALYVVLMLLPFQVTMLSSYLVLNRLNLINTHGAVILPAVFSAFPVFLCYNGFRGIPPQLLEAARIDGAGEMTIFVKLGLPLGKSGLLSAMVLGFLEYWNLMEQPITFLQDKALWPLSLYLPEITLAQAGSAFCASVITLIPAVFVFMFGQDYLEQGIIYSGLKE